MCTPIAALEDAVVDACSLPRTPQTVAALMALPALANTSPASVRETLNYVVPRLSRPSNSPASGNPKPRTEQRALLKRLPPAAPLASSPAHCWNIHRLSRPTPRSSR
jgi:hypothetical protein